MDTTQGVGFPQLPDNMPPPPAPPKQEPVANAEEDLVQINLPANIPRSMLAFDDKGNPIGVKDHELQLIPRGSVVLDGAAVKSEIEDIVARTKAEALPPGTSPQIADSPGGSKVAKGKQIAIQLGQMAGGFGTFQLMGSSPAAWAAGAATAGGAIGLIGGMDNVKKAYDMKAYYQNMKAQGQQYMQIPVQTKDGKTIVQNVKIDDLITGAKDAVVVGWMQTLGSGLMCASGLGGGPACAIASMVVSMGSFLYATRHALAAVAKKVGHFLANLVKREKKDKDMPDLPEMQEFPQANKEMKMPVLPQPPPKTADSQKTG